MGCIIKWLQSIGDKLAEDIACSDWEKKIQTKSDCEA